MRQHFLLIDPAFHEDSLLRHQGRKMRLMLVQHRYNDAAFGIRVQKLLHERLGVGHQVWAQDIPHDGAVRNVDVAAARVQEGSDPRCVALEVVGERGEGADEEVGRGERRNVWAAVESWRTGDQIVH